MVECVPKRSLRFFGRLYATIGRSKSSFVRSLAARMGKALFKRGCNGGRRELHLHTSGVLVCSWSATGALSLLVFKRASLDFCQILANTIKLLSNKTFRIATRGEKRGQFLRRSSRVSCSLMITRRRNPRPYGRFLQMCGGWLLVGSKYWCVFVGFS